MKKVYAFFKRYIKKIIKINTLYIKFHNLQEPNLNKTCKPINNDFCLFNIYNYNIDHLKL